jgi:hypothetical protein
MKKLCNYISRIIKASSNKRRLNLLAESTGWTLYLDNVTGKTICLDIDLGQ